MNSESTAKSKVRSAAVIVTVARWCESPCDAHAGLLVLNQQAFSFASTLSRRRQSCPSLGGSRTCPMAQCLVSVVARNPYTGRLGCRRAAPLRSPLPSPPLLAVRVARMRRVSAGVCQGSVKNIAAMKTWLRTTGSPKSRIDKAVFTHERADMGSLEFAAFDVDRE